MKAGTHVRLSVSAEPARWRTLPWPARAVSGENTGFTAAKAATNDIYLPDYP